MQKMDERGPGLTIWKFFRKLVRKRQFEKAFRYERNQVKLTELRCDRVLEVAQKQIDQLKETLSQRDKEILTLREADIPRLERKLEVAEAYAEYLAALHEKELAHVESVTAVENMRIDQSATRRAMVGNVE